MVVRLEGKVDGSSVILQLVRGGLWRCTIPRPVKTGRYIIELTAYDEAGNYAYTARYIFTVDTAALRVSLVPYPYSANMNARGYRAELEPDGYIALLIRDKK